MGWQLTRFSPLAAKIFSRCCFEEALEPLAPYRTERGELKDRRNLLLVPLRPKR